VDICSQWKCSLITQHSILYCYCITSVAPSPCSDKIGNIDADTDAPCTCSLPSRFGSISTDLYSWTLKKKDIINISVVNELCDLYHYIVPSCWDTADSRATSAVTNGYPHIKDYEVNIHIWPVGWQLETLTQIQKMRCLTYLGRITCTEAEEHLGGGGGQAAQLQPPTKLKFKKHRLCRHEDMKRFTWFTLPPKSATEIS